MMGKKKSVRLSTMQIIAAGFIGTILLGGVLLYLPICNTKPISFIDALFTSTTSVCVTGLVTVVPASQFTLVGKVILLILIQIGGLGVIASTFAFFILLKKRITLKQRVMIQETYGMDTLAGMVKLVVRIIMGTFLVEAIGAVCYSFQFIPEYGFLKGVGYSVFHSVSAFCNAGIDILGSGSFEKYVGNPIVNFTTMLLIIVSGIGFTVWYDLKEQIRCKNKERKAGLFQRLSLHSKLAITVTAILLVGGTVYFFLTEYGNPHTFGGFTIGEKLMASAFHSVSTRTAGFATVAQGELTNATKLGTCILMFIGGSPGGTAGGVKTTTAAMLVLTCFTVIRGGKDIECFGRRISQDNVKTGTTIVMTAFSFLFVGMIALTILEPHMEFLDLLYEATSAIGTVGLSAGLTSEFGAGAKLVLMALMYVGRIGPVTMALVFEGKRRAKQTIRELPEKRIMLG